jgi:hypothetical protein
MIAPGICLFSSDAGLLFLPWMAAGNRAQDDEDP